jgi:hypothetical protein
MSMDDKIIYVCQNDFNQYCRNKGEELNVHDRIKKSKLLMIDVFERQ